MMVQALGVVLQDEKYWKSPKTFDPKRFLEHKASGDASSWAFKPFGVGNRLCPASRYSNIPLALQK